MPLFEVFIPARDPELPNVTLTVEGRNWIEALRSGLKSIGEGQESIANVMCDIKEDSSIHVTDVATRRVFRLREVKKQEPQTIPDTSQASTTDAPRPVSIPDGGEDTIKMPGAAGGDFSGSPKTLIEFPVPKMAAPQAAPPLAVPPPAAPPQAAPPQAAPPQAAPQAAPPPAAHATPRSTQVATPASAPLGAPTPMPITGVAPFSRATPARGTPAPVAKAEQPSDTMKIDVSELIAPKPVPKPAPQPMPTPAKTSANEPTERIDRQKLATPRAVSPPTPRGVPAPAPKRPSGQFQNAPQPTSREESRPSPKDPQIGRAREPKVDVQDAIAAVFDATQDLYMEAQITPQLVAERLLDIALSHIPAESGTFYLADVNAHELTFSAVRGPKADALKRSGMTVPLGQGIIGFCAQEGICLSVSDIQKDPRWLASIAQAIDYKPKDTLCASAEKDGRLFGAIQLINSKSGFDASHMEVLRFIGLTAAALLEQATS